MCHDADIREALVAWFQRTHRDLPWRRTSDPYALWVSEVMLQQTGVKSVIPYYREFLRRFPTVRALARAPLDEVLKAWEGLGYYARARNLHKGAQFIVRRFRGTLPTTCDEWLQVPGVGPVTASALASYLSGEPRPAVDGNARRVISRLFRVRQRSSQRLFERNILKFAKRMVVAPNAGTLNQALMELGATVCKPRAPLCASCPVSRWCKAFAEGHPEKYPGRRVRPGVQSVRVVAAVIRRNAKILITRRPPEGLLGGLWEFPGGKIEAGESPGQALQRELREELGIQVRIGKPLLETSHRYTHLKVHLTFLEAVLVKGPIKPGRGCSAWRWVRHEELKRFAFPAADKAVIRLLTQARHTR
ncbi:MAG: A/G-specific adenine glycosylase [bacterium JZ-2024 1]